MKKLLFHPFALLLASCACAEPEVSPRPDVAPIAPEPTQELAPEPEPEALAPAPETEPESLPAFDQTHAAWTTILAGHVHGTNFDYASLKKNRKAFDAYLTTLAAVTPKELAAFSKDEAYAFWINAYNAWTIRLIIDNYPIKSIRKLDKGLFGSDSIFDREWIPMSAHHPEGKSDQLSLNDIEHEILRKKYTDARVHAAVNCASESCPPLLNEAFRGKDLQKQLDRQMRAFVNDAARNTYDGKSYEMRISEIFKWFKEDFVRDAGSVKKYLLQFANEENARIISRARQRYQNYSWDLNDHKSER